MAAAVQFGLDVIAQVKAEYSDEAIHGYARRWQLTQYVNQGYHMALEWLCVLFTNFFFYHRLSFSGLYLWTKRHYYGRLHC